MRTQAWLRSRGESATQVITAESMAEQYGVMKGTYEAVALPRVNTSVVRAARCHTAHAHVLLSSHCGVFTDAQTLKVRNNDVRGSYGSRV